MNNAQAIMAGFDIGNLDTTDVEQVTFKVAVIEDLDGEPVCGFVIVGKNSPEFQHANNAVRIDNIKRASKRSKQIDTSTEEGATAISKTVSSNEKIVSLAVVVDWFGFLLEGQPMTFDKAIVEKLFAKYPQWQVKVQAALDADANFMKV